MIPPHSVQIKINKLATLGKGLKLSLGKGAPKKVKCGLLPNPYLLARHVPGISDSKEGGYFANSCGQGKPSKNGTLSGRIFLRVCSLKSVTGQQ